MTTRAYPLTLLPCLLVFATSPAQEDFPPVRFADDFRTDTRKDYTIAGDVAWQNGRLTLAAGAQLQRSAELGSEAEVRLVVHFAAGQDEGSLTVRLLHPGFAV